MVINNPDLQFRITQKDTPILKILARLMNEELPANREFQCRSGLWDIPTKSRLIESMILGLPISPFYFSAGEHDKWTLIDGHLRLSTINDFLDNNFPLVGLDYMSALESKRYKDLTRLHQRVIEEYEVSAYFLVEHPPISVLHRIIRNINTRQ